MSSIVTNPEICKQCKQEVCTGCPDFTSLVAFNLNRMATVHLTHLGLRALLDHRQRHGPTHGEFKEKDNTFEAQVWELMEIFGPVIYHGAEMSPFVENEMTVDLESFP